MDKEKVDVDGVYKNFSFTRKLADIFGDVVRVQTTSKETYEGVFRAFSPKFEIVLDFAHPMSDSFETVKVLDTMIFRHEDIVLMETVEPRTEKRMPFFTKLTEVKGEKKLEPWDAGEGNECELSGKGWSVDEMFKENKEKFGVESSFSGLENFSSVQPNKNMEEKANQLATLIENDLHSKERLEAEVSEQTEPVKSNLNPNAAEFIPAQNFLFTSPSVQPQVYMPVIPAYYPPANIQQRIIVAPAPAFYNSTYPNLPYQEYQFDYPPNQQ